MAKVWQKAVKFKCIPRPGPYVSFTLPRPVPSGYRGRFAPRRPATCISARCWQRSAAGCWRGVPVAPGWCAIEDLDPPRESGGRRRSGNCARWRRSGCMPTARSSAPERTRRPLPGRTGAPAAAGAAFDCHCSRSDLAANGGIHRRCVARRERADPAIRLRVPDGTTVTFDDADPGAQCAGRQRRGRRLRAEARRRLLGLSARGGGRRRRAGHHRRGARRRPARFDAAADPAAARARPADAALCASAAGAWVQTAASCPSRMPRCQWIRRPVAGIARGLAGAGPGPGACGQRASCGAQRMLDARAQASIPARIPGAGRRGMARDVIAQHWIVLSCSLSTNPSRPSLAAAKERHMQSRVALVTGGTGGIGTSICKRLAGMGHKVATNYRNEEKAKAWQAQMRAAGHRGRPRPGRRLLGRRMPRRWCAKSSASSARSRSWSTTPASPATPPSTA